MADLLHLFPETPRLSPRAGQHPGPVRGGAPGLPAADGPVFVYGALRSGTTVFRLMLDQHPAIANPGEADFLFDFLHPDPSHPTGWRYDLPRLRVNRVFQMHALSPEAGGEGLDLLDALIGQMHAAGGGDGVFTLNIHRHIGQVLEIFPSARIIHMLRDPRDVARSSIGMGWASHLYRGVDHWIATERDWDRGAAGIPPEQVLTLTYEDLFRDTEAQLRRVCGFLGTPFNPAMLRYPEVTTYAAPDPGLVEQWRRRCDPDHVALLEGKAADLMRARGYAVTGRGRLPGAAERLALWLDHKTGGWRHGIRKYGARLFLGEKLLRWLRLRGGHARLRNRMNRIEIAGLK